MTNKEQIKRDIVVAFNFVERIIDNPEILDKIPVKLFFFSWWDYTD